MCPGRGSFLRKVWLSAEMQHVGQPPERPLLGHLVTGSQRGRWGVGPQFGMAMRWSEHERHLGRELEEAGLPGTAPGGREEEGLTV